MGRTACWPRLLRIAIVGEHSLPTVKKSFAWGISTSSYQFEDPAVRPGDPAYFETDWDACLVRRGRAPARGNALSSWTHFGRDLAALKRIGVTHYRFGIEWARIEPQPGAYNEAAIARYVAMAESLRAAGIEPIVCLWHFTFPSWLFSERHPRKSNWLHPESRTRWQAFVRKVVPRLAPSVRIFAPQNEPNGQLTTAYLAGLWPPGVHLEFPVYRKALLACVGHFQDAAEIIRGIRRDAQILSIHALPWWKRGRGDVSGFMFRKTMEGSYEHLDRVADTCDLVGINYYYSLTASIAGFISLSTHRGPHYSMMGWRIDPDGLYEQIKFCGDRYKKPMMITENGVATPADSKRVRYLQDHLAAVQRAVEEGRDVRGYFAWSLADNYEWHYGYKAKFGLCRMNPRTFERELKPSAKFYQRVIAANGI